MLNRLACRVGLSAARSAFSSGSVVNFGLLRDARRMITFYDICGSTPDYPWSPNTWKTRLLLNFKQIPYQTKWISYPDIEPEMKRIGASPTSQRADGSPFYTLPVIKDGDNIISDSYTIAEYLENTYNLPSVFPPRTKACQAAVLHYLSTTLIPVLRPLITPHSVNILDSRGAEYFRRTRESKVHLGFGRPLEEVLPLGTPEREAQWQKVETVLDTVASWMEQSESEGVDLFGGKEGPVYADLVLAANLLWVQRIKVPDGWSRIAEWHDGRWAQLLNLCEAWVEVR